MPAKKKARDIEKDYSPKQFAAKLRRFANAVEKGETFSIQISGERLRVPKGARFNIEHERDDEGEEIEFQIKWSHEEGA